MGTKVKGVSSPDGALRGYSFWCPGCAGYHVIYTEPWDSGSFQTVDGEKKWVPKVGPVWQFNGDLERPTFSPSLLIYEGRYPDGTLGYPRCHSFVRAGEIQYCSDSGHDLAGQTVEMVDYDAAP